MHSTIRGFAGVAAASALLLLGACGRDDAADQRVVVDGAAGTQTQPTVAQQPAMDTTQMGMAGQQGGEPEMRIEIDVQARQLHVYRGGQRIESHGVAVGTSEWPTRTGEWTIGQVVWNPEWIPPQEEWAKDETRKAPGAADNPLGRAQLVYDAPRSIHGTNEPQSIGQAASHGSIRVTNEVAVQLARQAMEAGGAGRDDAWYRRMQENRSQRESVSLPRPIPIRVHNGGGTGGR